MEQLLENTVLGGVMILAAALLRWVLRGKISPNVTLLLWAVCLARLMTPVRWSSALSLYALPALAGRPVRGSVANLPAPGVTAAESGTGSGHGTAAVVYLAVAAVLAALFVLAWFSTRRRVRSVAPVAESDPRRAGLPAGTVLREGDMRGAPLTFGALRPNVVLTPGLDGRALCWVLIHEGVHVRRRDNLWHYAMAAALAVHWFNPAVWLMAGLLRRDVELSCDRAVLSRLGADRRAEYANALIDLSKKTESPAFCHGFGLKRTEERIVAIMKYKKTTVCGLLAALVLILGATAVFATSPEGDAAPDAATQVVDKSELPEWVRQMLDGIEGVCGSGDTGGAPVEVVLKTDGLYVIMPDGQAEKMDDYVKWFNENHPDALPSTDPESGAYYVLIMPGDQVEVVDRDGACLPELERMMEDLSEASKEIMGLRTPIGAHENA